MLVVQKMERDEWCDLALLPFELDSASCIRRARLIARALHQAERGTYRVFARRESPPGATPAFEDGDVLWAS